MFGMLLKMYSKNIYSTKWLYSKIKNHQINVLPYKNSKKSTDIIKIHQKKEIINIRTDINKIKKQKKIEKNQ